MQSVKTTGIQSSLFHSHTVEYNYYLLIITWKVGHQDFQELLYVQTL